MDINYFIREIRLDFNGIESKDEYPYCIPAIKNLSKMELHPKVTYIEGENGMGKSTILEAIACSYGFNPEGGSKNFNFSTSDTHSELWKAIKIVKGVKIPEDGFFLRAESFYNLASNIDELKVEASYGGSSLHCQSHGESFMSLVMNRFRGYGLYILDEPEAALSPTRQMALLSRIHDLVEEGSQFIIATHSPIVMSYPDSIIYHLGENIEKVDYRETDTYQIFKSFLNNPEKMLDILGIDPK